MGIGIFPIASVTNNYKLGGFRPHRFIIYSCESQKFQMSLAGLKLRHRRGCAPCEYLEENPTCIVLHFEALVCGPLLPALRPATAGQVLLIFHHSDADSPASFLHFSGLL